MSARRVARGFDRLARGYDLLARLVYGNALRRAQTELLERFSPGFTVLVVGGGSGWMLVQLLRRMQPKRVTYVDLSPGMLALARARVARELPEALHKVDFVEADATSLELAVKSDVLVTHCLLDMFGPETLPALMERLWRQLREGGVWYFSDFRIADRWPMSWVSRFLVWVMYRVFRLACRIEAERLPDFGALFGEAGWVSFADKHYFGGMIEARLLIKDDERFLI